MLSNCSPELMRNGFAVDDVDTDKTLVQAVKDEDIDAIVGLYAAKADLNQRVDEHGRTCLHYAVQHNKLRLLRILTSLGSCLCLACTSLNQIRRVL